MEKKQRAILALPLPLSTSRVQTKYLSRWIDWLISTKETVDLILLSEKIGMRETMNLKKRWNLKKR